MFCNTCIGNVRLLSEFVSYGYKKGCDNRER